MARSPNGHHYPWYNDAVWCRAYGNGIIIDVTTDDIIVRFEFWTGTMDKKIWHRPTESILKEEFEYCWISTGWGGYWRLDHYE